MFEDLASAGSYTGTPQALLDDANKYKKDLYVADGEIHIIKKSPPFSPQKLYFQCCKGFKRKKQTPT